MDIESTDRWALRRRRAADVTLSGGGHLEHIDWDTVRRWQAEFRDEFCPGCAHAAEAAAGDCERHWTDIVGQCWNYRSARAA